MPILIDVAGNKFMEASHGTRFYCVNESCAWNDKGACFFKGQIKIGVACEEFTLTKPIPELPKDYEDPACSSGRRCWVTARFYARSRDEVLQKKAAYFQKYPHEGYSTYDCGPLSKTVDGFHCAVVMRYSTCD